MSVRLLPKVSRDSGLIVFLLCHHPVDFLEKKMKIYLSSFWQCMELLEDHLVGDFPCYRY